MRVGEAGVKDPALTVLLQHWKTLWKIFRKMQHCTAQLQHTWGALWSKLGSNPHRWKSVKGPLAAMIAYLSDLGILASSLWQWVLPENTKVPGVAGQAVPRMIPIDLADPYTEHRVAAALEAVYLRRSDAIISRQDGASQGSGVEPLDWTLPRLLTKKFRSQPRLLSGMRALWQGALPTSSKTRQRVCPACKVPADLDHILWHCQWWTAVEGTVPPEFQAWRARCPDWVTPLDDCHSHAGWRLCSWHHFSRLVNAIQVAGGYPTQEEAQWRTSAWVVRISVEGYPITFNLLTQRIDRQVAHLEAVAGVATQPGADPQAEAGQAPPEPTLAEQGATATVTPFLAPEEPSNTAAIGPLEAPAEAGREPFLAPEDSSSGSASASDNSTSPARDPDSGTTEESPDRQCPQGQPEGQVQHFMPSAGGTFTTQPEGGNPTDQEETPFLHPAEISRQEPAAHTEQETPYVGPF